LAATLRLDKFHEKIDSLPKETRYLVSLTMKTQVEDQQYVVAPSQTETIAA